MVEVWRGDTSVGIIGGWGIELPANFWTPSDVKVFWPRGIDWKPQLLGKVDADYLPLKSQVAKKMGKVDADYRLEKSSC